MKKNKFPLIALLFSLLLSCQEENIAPNCTISGPTNNETYTIGDTISIIAAATDEDGTIKEIKLAINDLGITFVTKNALEYNWDTSDEIVGNYKISVIAVDDDNSETTTEVTVTLIRAAELPVISIDSTGNITESSASVFCKVLNLGYPELTEVGVCWVQDNVPSITDNHVTQTYSESPFQINFDGLEVATTYQVRAYAINNEGITYSEILSFTPFIAENETSTMEDIRDSQTYNTVKIGNKWWLAQELNFYTTSSLYFNNDSLSFNDFGRLYTYADALNSCPDGWHVASDEDWISLEIATGMSEEEAYTTGWRGEGIGTLLKLGEVSHFEAELVGCEYDGNFGDNGIGYWWTSTKKDEVNIWFRSMSSSFETIERNAYPDEYRFSVRCVMD